VGEFPIGFGRYQLVERLAVGGMAELFVATAPGEHGFQKKVVIKRLLPHLVDDATYNAMFIDEAKLTARLIHPKIAQTFELGKVASQLYIAMELVDGIDVLALLREFAGKRRRVQPQLAAWIAHEVLDALDYAHHVKAEDGAALGVVHRDISPSNVLLSVRGDVKLIDFGIARAVDPDRAHKSKSGTLKGKYGYMSPEQVIEQTIDARSDLFSVGVVLAELLTGRRLFAAANELDVLLMVRDAKLARLDKYGADIEPGLNDIVRKALRKPVDERWPSAAAFRDALAEWLFEQRHRVTNRHVADVVAELRESVIARRHKTISATTALLEDGQVAHAPAQAQPPPPPPAGSHRAASDTDGAPIIVVEAGESMPHIAVSYDLPQALEGDTELELGPPGSSVSTGMPASSSSSGPTALPLPPLPALPALPAPQAADTVPQRPAVPAERGRIPSAGILPPMQTPAGTGAGAGSGSGPLPGRTGHSQPRIALERAAGGGGAIEAPIFDTISAAVEAITIPAPDEDSGMHAFDELGETAPPRSHPRPPSADEALRKKPPTPPLLTDIAEPPDDSGDFHVTSPLRVLFRLMTARATGLLVVAVGGIKKEIYVRDGQPEYVSSNVASELFGNYLVTKGVLSDGELAMALAMMPHYGGKLGDTLVGLGLLKPLEVFRHLTRQVRTKIIDVCTWNKGAFGWYAGRENPREAFPLDFNAFEILGAGAMVMPDSHIESWIARNGSLRLRASRTRRVGPERFELKGLAEMCDQLDGRRSVADIVEAAPDRAERTRIGRMLFLLEATDLARAT
jgi:eukaryotic-like serine/threonine-protein kinase